MKKNWLVILGLWFLTLPCFALDLNKEPQLQSYIDYLSNNYQFEPGYLQKVFGQANFNQTVIDKMEQSTHPMPWYQYRAIFIKPERIQAGADFWRKNKVALATAQSQYGVPAEMIIGIIGVETAYGENKGSISTLDALTTLAFHYPRRAAFFKNELTEYLLLCREQHWDPTTIKGSYAGALGLPQFMPSSYRLYAVDYHRDGVKDLFNGNEDVVVSIANYFQKKGWKPNQPVVVAAEKTSSKADGLAAKKQGKTLYNLKTLAKNGLVPVTKVSNKFPAGVLFLTDKDGIEHWITFTNFSVIKKYNGSNYYALSAYELGNLVKAAVFNPKAAS